MIELRTDPRQETVRPARRYWYEELRAPRVGVCLHYDGSSSDAGGLSWLLGVDVHASYNLYVKDDGSWGIIAPLHLPAWHAGKSRSSDPERLPYPNNMANHGLYGLAVLTNGQVDVTPPQLLTAAWLTARLFAKHGWSRTDELYRVTTHSAEAWKRGRKTDPEGGDLRNPIMSADDVRHLLPMFQNVEAL